MKTILCDLDGTLANLSHRLHYITKQPGVKRNFQKFLHSCIDDTVIYPVAHMIRTLYATNHKIIIMSGRTADRLTKSLTVEWLLKHEIPYHEIHMRTEGDYRADDIIKEELFNNSGISANDVVAVFDDRPRVVKMWREKFGFYVFDCNYESRDF